MAPTATCPLTPCSEAGVHIRDVEKLRIHMVGIGGCGMSALGAMLLRRGSRVTGSDRQASSELDRLVALGARISTIQRHDTLPGDAELVVVSAAIGPDHPERLEALRRGLPVLKYAQLLGLIMSQYEGIAISGTHGKSTTTAWTAYTLRQAGLDPNFVIGASVEQLGGGSGVGDGRQFVVEACEYDRSFHNLAPRIAAILNIEEDHLDCYHNIDEIETAFRVFARKAPADGLLILNGRDARCRNVARSVDAEVQYFGDCDDAHWRAEQIALEGGRYAFNLAHQGAVIGRVQLGLAGRHNVDNALVVAAIAHRCGVAWDVLAASLAGFHGARRRLEVRGEVNGVRVVDDYAHHPTEIRATLYAARERFEPRKLWCVFQPHQHSRTRFLLADFARSFADADEVIVPDIYFVRDSERERELVSAQDLVQRVAETGRSARYMPEFGAIIELLARDVRPGDIVMTMGAGNIWRVADELVQRLGARL